MARRGRRTTTQMTSEEIDAFLQAERTLLLVTLRPDGSPMAHALWFAKLGEALYVNTRSDSLKLKNIEGDPRVCAIVEAGEEYRELRGVRVEGRCQEVTDPEEAARVQAAQAEKGERIGGGMSEMPAWFSGSRARRLDRGDRVLLRIPMERVYSWDFSKLRRHYAQAVPDRTEERSS